MEKPDKPLQKLGIFCLDFISENIFWHLQTCTAYAQCHYHPTWAERLTITFMVEFVWDGLGVLPHNSQEQGGDGGAGWKRWAR